MDSSVQENEQLQFSYAADILRDQRALRQRLLDDKYLLQRKIVSLGVTHDEKSGRPIIPAGKENEYERVFQEIMNIQKKINAIPLVIQTKQAEMGLSHLTD